MMCGPCNGSGCFVTTDGSCALVVQLPTLHLAHASHSLRPLSTLHTRLRRPLSRRANRALMFAIKPLPPTFPRYPLPFAGSTPL